jgi:hypothetical protein
MFLLRTAFWLSVVVMLLPADASTGDKAPRVTAFEALGAARAAVEDISQFCARNPDVCTTGDAAFHVFADKVRYGAKMIRGFVDDGGGNGTTIDRGTLKPGDTDPAWQDPHTAKPA